LTVIGKCTVKLVRKYTFKKFAVEKYTEKKIYTVNEARNCQNSVKV
jgi:hypothetical protein